MEGVSILLLETFLEESLATSIPNVSPTNTDATFSVDGAATSAHDTNEFDHTCKHTGVDRFPL